MSDRPFIPSPRFFTQADGRVVPRACLAAARDAIRYAKRFCARNYGQTHRLTANQIARAFDNVRKFVSDERARWDALSPSLRAAATAFDAAIVDHRDSDGRADAIRAMAEGRPALWHPFKTTACNYTALINQGFKDAQMRAGSRETVFEALIAREIAFPGTLANLTALNPAGAQLLRIARAAVAARTRNAAA